MKFRIRSVPTLRRAEAHTTGKMRISRVADLQAFGDLLGRERALLKELFHEGVVALGDHFHQRVMGLLGRFSQVGGDLAFLALAVSIGGVGVGLHANQVHDAVEIAFGSDGDLDGDGKRGQRSPARC